MDLAHGGGNFEQRNVLHPPAVVLIPGLVMSFYVWLVLVTTIPYPGKIGLDYNTLGTDWMVFYGAIRSVLDGNAPLIFDGDRFTDFLNTTFAGWLSTPLEFRPWAYPPSFLLILLPFAPLGFFGSYVAFQVVTGALLAVALRSSAGAVLPSGALLVAALACPASAINAINGQAVFLVAALIVGGFGLLERRPYLGGLVLGLLTFKPQFCILVPIALIAAGQWRALLAAGLFALAMMIASGLIFGWDLWLRWFPAAGGWMHAKLALVVVLIGYHVWCGKLVHDFQHGRNRHGHAWYRWFNEFPVLILAAVVILVVVQPF